MEYSTFQFPFPTPMSALVVEDDLVDFPTLCKNTDTRFVPGRERKTCDLKNILTLRKDYLVCWRAESSSTVFDKQTFVIVPVQPGAEFLEVPDEDNVLYLFMEDFTFNPIDYVDGYKLGRGEGYIEVHTKGREDKAMTVFSLCVSLSYRFGTLFKFWDMYEVDSGNRQYLISLDKTCSNRTEVLDTIDRHAKDIVRNYKDLTSMSVHQDKPQFNIPDPPAPVLEEGFD